jgi:FixJ family two-component response regulator
MAPTMKLPADVSTRAGPCVLIVDDEPACLDAVNDILARQMHCRVLRASSLHEAREQFRASGDPVQLLLIDKNLPDGDGISLVPALRQHNPTAEAVVITGDPSLDGAIGALRAGAIDFLPKPFSAEHLQDRIRRALKRQELAAKVDKRLVRLRRAVRRLNVSRRMVSKKVDLLCNDLVSAYGELSKQVDAVRTQESFRKLLDAAKDLEQLLCHAMDWVLRHAGYANVAIWLAADDANCELGAYMKYTIAGDKALTEAMKNGLLPLVQREGFVHLQPEDLSRNLPAAECGYLAGQTVLAANCTYLGETLATVVAFRDARSPFTEDDELMLKAISPIFATSLASVVRKHRGDDIDDLDDDGTSPFYDDSTARSDDADENSEDDAKRRERAEAEQRRKDRERERRERSAADWWKRGEPPPF